MKIFGRLGLDTLSAGIKMGREAKRLFPVRFEEMLNRPLEEVRKETEHYPTKRWFALVSLSWIKGRWSILLS